MSWRGVEVNTAPSIEPVTLEEARRWVRVDHFADNDELERLITAARTQYESETNRICINTVFDKYLQCFPANRIVLLPAPLVSVASITYIDQNGDSQTVSTDVYDVDTSRRPGVVFLKDSQNWPTDIRTIDKSIRIRFTAGMGTTRAEMDPRSVQAIKILIGRAFPDREGIFEFQKSDAYTRLRYQTRIAIRV